MGKAAKVEKAAKCRDARLASAGLKADKTAKTANVSVTVVTIMTLLADWAAVGRVLGGGGGRRVREVEGGRRGEQEGQWTARRPVGEHGGQAEWGWPSSDFGAGAGMASKGAKRAKRTNVLLTVLTLWMDSAPVLGW